MIEVKEILRLWLDGRSLREVTVLAAVDRKTVRLPDPGRRRWAAPASARSVR